MYLDYLEYNGINKNHAKLMQKIALHKDDFTMTLLNAMRLMGMNMNDKTDIEIVLNLIKRNELIINLIWTNNPLIST